MKKILLILSFGLLLSSCVNNPSSSQISSEVSSESSSSSSITSSNVSSSKESSISSSEAKEEKVEKSLYGYHPFSEPSINKQLITFNPMGDMSNVWDYYRGDNVTVAVIDSGFDYDHPEFVDINGNNRVSEKSAYIYTNSSKQVKVEVGRSKVNITDGDSHGTMCAGLLGSSVNKVGITGIAPNVDLILIKIDKHADSMNEAFKYAADNGAKVISTSLGQYPNSNGESGGDIHFEKGIDLSTVFNEGVNYAYSKGVTIVAATGNSRETRLSYPAGCSNVIGAGGLNAGSQTQIWDNGYEGSNYNSSKVYVDVFAPSDGIYAPGFDTSTNKPTYWGDAKGTSFAAPLIAGAIALYYQKYPTATNTQVETALKNACVNISSYNNGKNMGYGRLDVGKLLNISEDIEKESISSSGTISQNATKLVVHDEAGWDFRTLHLFNVTFEPGYGYKELDRYFDYVYGDRIGTSSYQVEGTKKSYAYTDEGYIGDYYLCLGNTDHAKATNYEYIFPWWVTGASYQIVNNSNWLPEGGLSFGKSEHGQTINSYFWYKGSNDTGIGHEANGTKFNTSFPSVTIKENVNGKLTSKQNSIYDYYEPSSNKNWYVDSDYQTIYTRTLLSKDSTIYSK